MADQQFWSLYNRLSGKQIDGLLFDEARAIVCYLDEDEQELWVVWHDGWSKWKGLFDVPGLIEPPMRSHGTKTPELPGSATGGSSDHKVREVEFTPPPSFEPSMEMDLDATNSGNRGETLVDAVDYDLTLEGEVLEERKAAEIIERSYKRFVKAYPVEITLEDKKFKTESIDIGVGGIQLKDPLPRWVVGYFKVRIIKTENNQRIELTCFLVENQSAGERKRVAILPLLNKEDEKRLEGWLAA